MFAVAGSATADAPEPTPTFDDVTVTVALHSGAFELAWAVHKEEIKALYGINMEIVRDPRQRAVRQGDPGALHG